MMFKCRDVGEPETVREVEVDERFALWPDRTAAQEYAESRWESSDYASEMEVEVLIDRKWVTYEVVVRSVPEFEASKKRGVEPKPWLPVCEWCGQEFAGDPAFPNQFCNDCHTKLFAEEEDDAG
jgi:hypothetical protein